MNQETTYAKCRNYEDGYYPPIEGYDAEKIDWQNEYFICWQPDELDEREFNLILYCQKRDIIFRGLSIDFDFPTKEELKLI